MKTAFLFPGYGSQAVGMGKEMYDTYRIVQEYFEEASHCLNVNFVKLCFASSEHELAKPHNAFPAIFLVTTSYNAVLKHEGIAAQAVFGFDIGHIAALHSVGAITLPDALYFLSKYALLLEESSVERSHELYAVHGVHIETIVDWSVRLSRGMGEIIAIYRNDQCIVLVDKTCVSLFDKMVKDNEGSIAKIAIGFGLHSLLAQPIVEQMRVYDQKVDFNDSGVPVLSPLDASLVHEGYALRAITLHMLESVLRFDLVFQQLRLYDSFVFFGRQPHHLNFLDDWYLHKKIYTVNVPSDVHALRDEYKN